MIRGLRRDGKEHSRDLPIAEELTEWQRNCLNLRTAAYIL